MIHEEGGREQRDTEATERARKGEDPRAQGISRERRKRHVIEIERRGKVCVTCVAR